MAYLFVHFTSEQPDGEQVYFAYSDDGMHWQDLNGDKPVFRSAIGEEGVRDPFMIMHPTNGKYYIIATDLRIAAGKGWGVAQHQGSRDIIVWETSDITNWGQPRSITVGVDNAGCVWAPESIWDEEEQAFFVFWSSMVQFDGDPHPKQRIYAAHTKDFISFTKPFVYYEAENHVIDMNIIYDNGWYYRFMKDETTKKIKMDRVKTLIGAEAQDIHVPVLASLDGVEGPQTYKLPDGRWCLIVDQFGKGLGYLPIIINDLENGDFVIAAQDAYSMGATKKRHGSVTIIPDGDLSKLKKMYYIVKQH